MLNLTHLKVLAAVARHGWVTEVAKELHYSQPSISRHLGRLEAAAGQAHSTCGPRNPTHPHSRPMDAIVDHMPRRMLGPRVDDDDGKTVGIAALQQRDAFADAATHVGAALLEHLAAPV